MTTDEEVLGRLVATQAITEVLYRYCRGLDRMDRAVALAVWHPDGTADYGPGMFQGTGAGFVEWVWEQHAPMLRHSHQITNVLIEVDGGGDHAASEAYVTVALRAELEPGRPVDIVSRGRYLDRWSRRGGVWAIDHRRFVEVLTNVHAVTGAPMTDAAASASRRDRDDPSYQVLGR